MRLSHLKIKECIKGLRLAVNTLSQSHPELGWNPLERQLSICPLLVGIRVWRVLFLREREQLVKRCLKGVDSWGLPSPVREGGLLCPTAKAWRSWHQ